MRGECHSKHKITVSLLTLTLDTPTHKHTAFTLNLSSIANIYLYYIIYYIIFCIFCCDDFVHFASNICLRRKLSDCYQSQFILYFYIFFSHLSMCVCVSVVFSIALLAMHLTHRALNGKDLYHLKPWLDYKWFFPLIPFMLKINLILFCQHSFIM